MTSDSPVRVVDTAPLAGAGFGPNVVAEVERIVAGLRPDVSCLATGSIVEGFGNRNSDLDLYIIHPEATKTVVAIGIRETNYVDCEHMSVESMQALADRMAGQSWSTVLTVRHKDLDRYYRTAIAIPIVVTEAAADVLAGFSREAATATFERVAFLNGYESLAAAACHLAFGREREAELLLRECAWWHSSSLLAAEGEGYPSVKWMGEKAARRHGRGSRRFHELVDEAVRPSGSLADRVERRRAMMPVPDALRDALHGRDCRLRSGVQLIARGQDQLLVRGTRTAAAVDGVVAQVCRHLVEGSDWSAAVERSAAEHGLPALEVEVAAWSYMAPLRLNGFVEEVES